MHKLLMIAMSGKDGSCVEQDEKHAETQEALKVQTRREEMVPCGDKTDLEISATNEARVHIQVRVRVRANFFEVEVQHMPADAVHCAKMVQAK